MSKPPDPCGRACAFFDFWKGRAGSTLNQPNLKLGSLDLSFFPLSESEESKSDSKNPFGIFLPYIMVWKPGVRDFRFFSDNLLMDKTIVQAVILA
jgi:hypothetical protein